MSVDNKDNFFKGYVFGTVTLAVGMIAGASLTYMVLTRGLELGIFSMQMSMPQQSTYPPYESAPYPNAPRLPVTPPVEMQTQEYYAGKPFTFIVQESAYFASCVDPELTKPGPDEQ